VVTVRAGTPLAELEALLANKGQCLPFEPPRFGAGGTVGGMVAAGLSGPARASVGAVRDYVLGVQMVNGRGELLTFGGQVMKNVAGYDVSRLMAGSWGTLGVITEVSLKVLPVAPAEATLKFECLTRPGAAPQLNRWGGQPLPLNASCWVRRAARHPVRAPARRRGRGGSGLPHMGGERQDNARALPTGPPAATSAAGFRPAGGDALWRLSRAADRAQVLWRQPGAEALWWNGTARSAGSRPAPTTPAIAARGASRRRWPRHAVQLAHARRQLPIAVFTPLAPLAAFTGASRLSSTRLRHLQPGRLYAEL
jgi:glycolate oxidase FAD binding subunit